MWFVFDTTGINKKRVHGGYESMDMAHGVYDKLQMSTYNKGIKLCVIFQDIYELVQNIRNNIEVVNIKEIK